MTQDKKHPEFEVFVFEKIFLSSSDERANLRVTLCEDEELWIKYLGRMLLPSDKRNNNVQEESFG